MNNRWLPRLAFAVALAPLAIAAFASPAQAYDHHRDWHRDHDRGHYDRGYYSAPPPPVYYAPPQPRPSAGISLFFPIR
jgi:hypothetical protein